MKRFIQGTLALSLGLGLWLATTTTASASQYSAKRSNSVRLIWRKPMKQHQFTANQGYRYSKHLAVRYDRNASISSTTWFTDAHEKFYQKNRHNYAIYYHVRNGDGSMQGWIWRGYLKPVPKPVAPKVTPAYVKTEAAQAKEITKFFPGVKTDKRLMKLAQDFVLANNDTETYNQSWEFCVESDGFSPKEARQIRLISSPDGSVEGDALTNAYKSGKLNLKDYFSKIAMSKGAPIPYKEGDYPTQPAPVNYNQFKGWHIGVATVTSNDTRDLEIGYPTIYVALMPGK
ncbi:hypothetical protein ACUIJQ_12440 [Levilactobacillus hammesii]|uniref:D-alanyl-D-alanine carboxypeptidase n=1 Tax=Levilactobacillus hammesii DSM 16381 TaxID=1423753 RepID=A0A0R1UY41_9LACO|nr:hypothetical protein [Levilactobacillus hammesii]KRL98221.1 hypothetical protein FD28_GL000019 [Levilactobacillus hammesii DSM 16381]